MPSAYARPYFFLSYARTPRRDPGDKEDPDRWVHKLYRDLCAEILQMTDAEPDEAGFMDRDFRLGAEWAPELVSALATCRVFVPLYSRRYFESNNCGKEWFAFARREVNYHARRGEPVYAVVPALWSKIAQNTIPEVAQQIQYDHIGLGHRYLAEGFYGIMKLSSFRHDYQRAVHRLAERIIEVADETDVKPDPNARQTTFASLQSAFGPASVRRTESGQLQIAVLAHDISTIPPGRSEEYYGNVPQTWSPYRPEYHQPLADYARELATKCLDCPPVMTSFDGLGANGRPMPPSLCLIDAWVATSPGHEKWLRKLNALDEPWVSVLLPWNSQDQELAGAQELKNRLGELLGRRLAGVPRQCQLASSGIPTLEEFGQLLPEMIMTMLRRFRKGLPAYPPPGPRIEQPQLRDFDDSGGDR